MRRTAFAALAALALSCFALKAESGTATVCGDADANGFLTATDALGALRAAVGVQNCSIWQCDVNNDGVVSSTDAYAVLLRVVGTWASLDCPLPPEAVDEADERVEIINDPQRLAEKLRYTWESLPVSPAAQSAPSQSSARIEIINDADKLAQKIHRSEAPVRIQRNELEQTDMVPAISVSLDLIAEVESPRVNGTRLQATAVHPGATKNHFLVAYNVRGPVQRGAVDYFNIQDPSVPDLRSEALFTDADVNHVASDGVAVYLATATSDESFEAPAVLEVLYLHGENLTLEGHRRRALSSYAANCSLIDGRSVYVTTGDNGHLFALDLSDLSVQSTSLLDDARWVDVEDGKLVVVQGTPGRIATFDQSTFAPLGTFAFEGARTAESKSTVQVLGGKAFVAAGRDGVQVLSTVTGAALGSLPIPALPDEAGIDGSDVTTNAISIVGRVAFVSNGGAGVYVAVLEEDPAATDSETPVRMQYYGRVAFDGVESINHVWYTGENLVVAAGRGGVRVLRVVVNTDGEPPAPVFEYRMDECEWRGTGGEVIDSGSSGRHADALGGALISEGMLCRAGEFGDRDSRVQSTTHIANQEFGDAITMMAWVRWIVPPHEGAEDAAILQLHAGASDEAPAVALGHGNGGTRNGHFTFDVRTTEGTIRRESVSGPDTGRWIHIAGVYDGSQLEIYVNGQGEGAIAHGGRIVSDQPRQLLIAGGNGDGALDGRVDEVLVFDTALSARQIQQIYVRNLGGRGWNGDDRYCDDCTIVDWCMSEHGVASCDDRNPCTRDECTEFGCVNAPLTGTACSDSVSCTDDVCVEGACMSTTNCPPDTECSETLDTCIVPCRLSEDCDDGNPCTDDGCAHGACTWVLNSAPCKDGSACTTDDRCTFGVCIGRSDCPPGQRCDRNTDRCEAACDNDEECDDGDDCTLDSCLGGACLHSPLRPCGNECRSDDDCDDLDSCTIDACLLGECTYAVPTLCPPQHCTANIDCEDLEACTEDRCSDGMCANRRIPDCGEGCERDVDCDDGDRCTVDRCIGRSCLVMAQENCAECVEDLECNDGDPCTDDRCQAGSCEFVHLSGCGSCRQDSDCGVMSRCQEARCIADECMVFPVAGCNARCSQPTDCDDGDPCTRDLCDRGICRTEPVADCGGECTGDSDCTIDADCMVAACIDATCTANRVPGCSTDTCSADRDCDDGNSCTHNSCVDGFCETVGYAGCEPDSDSDSDSESHSVLIRMR